MKTILTVEETKKRLCDRYNEVKKRRKRGELTHDVIASECAVTVAAVNKWFSQKDNSLPILQNWVNLAELLDCDVDYLLGLQDPPRKEYAHIAKLTGLTYDAAGCLVSMANANSSLLSIISGIIEDSKLLRYIFSAAVSEYKDGYIEDGEKRLYVKAQTLYAAEKDSVFIELMEFIDEIRKQNNLQPL